MSLIKRKVLNKMAFWISYVKLIPILRKIDSSSFIIDCGANIGDICALFLTKNASIIAFEPDPMAYKLLVDRFEGNPNITCHNKAVSDEDCTAKLYFHTEQHQNSHSAYTVSSSIVKNKVNINSLNSIEVEAVDLDRYISNLNRWVDILKMDVEGAEIDILEKMIQNKTYQNIGLILVETHETKIPGHHKKVAAIKATIDKLKIKNIKLNWI
ncbi:FkbM family methyltransferase [Anditalea andensis]|uniref:Methyltransferase FkbM domain-containing protein n=1 Tax=Anditalea andensis TaxID=1048983 RepID=A0A074L018_9BACT|nr:FkbM family methyltransferase [Anditalea andensis]KEO75576.1 hypothetical protein EL17_00340 [Anditalea andensis]